MSSQPAMSMKLLCAYSVISPHTARFLQPYTVSTFLYPCRHWSDYFSILKQHWSYADQFINIEQDIVPTHAALMDLWDCKEGDGWCTQPYLARGGGMLTEGLGCTRFSKALMEGKGKGLFERIGDLPVPQSQGRGVYVSGQHWQYLDIWVRDMLKEVGARVHVHGIQVDHDLGSVETEKVQ